MIDGVGGRARLDGGGRRSRGLGVAAASVTERPEPDHPQVEDALVGADRRLDAGLHVVVDGQDHERVGPRRRPRDVHRVDVHVGRPEELAEPPDRARPVAVAVMSIMSAAAMSSR